MVGADAEPDLLGPGENPPTYDQVASQPASRRGSITFQPFSAAGSLADLPVRNGDSTVPEPVAARLQGLDVNPLTPPPGYTSPAGQGSSSVELATMAAVPPSVARPSPLAAAAQQVANTTLDDADA